MGRILQAVFGHGSLRRASRRRGQTMTEYAIIVALVAIASIAVIGIFGDKIRAIFAGAANQLGGDQNAEPGDFNVNDAQQGDVKKDLGNW